MGQTFFQGLQGLHARGREEGGMTHQVTLFEIFAQRKRPQLNPSSPFTESAPLSSTTLLGPEALKGVIAGLQRSQ